MSAPLALGIDVGTSGVRCAALAPGGRIDALSEAAMDGTGPDRRVPSVWARTLATALARLFDQIAPSRIAAVAVDGTSGTVLAVDAAGDPAGPALMYDDAVDDPAIPEAIAAVAPRESAAHGASSALARACVLQRRHGAVRIVHQADWIAGLLAGAEVPGDESNSLKTGYDPVARRWPGWLAQTPLRPGLLPEVVPAGERTGETCGAFGLPRGVAIVAGVTDGCASFLATGAAEAGEGVTALGTTLTLKLLSEHPVFVPAYGIYSHRIGDVWLAGGASNAGGGALARFFRPPEIAELSATIDPDTDSGLDYYPLPRPGERFPVNDATFRPRVAPRPAEDARFLHGLLEGIARIEALGYRRLAEFGAPVLRCIRSVGGGAANPVWTAMRSRILGVPVAAAMSESAAAGVARLALRYLERSA